MVEAVLGASGVAEAFTGHGGVTGLTCSGGFPGTFIHTHTHAHAHTHACTNTHTYTHKHMHAHTHTYINTPVNREGIEVVNESY